MNRISRKFRELNSRNKKAFIAFLIAGDPSLKTTENLVLGFEKNGVDIAEIGIPFSDPLADGPTIQRASERALRNKVNVDAAMRLVTRLRKKSEIPIVFLTYYNLIHNYGLDRFVKKAFLSGADGVVVPDLPPEESGALRAIAGKVGLCVIHLASPTSPPERLKKIAASSTGFIYYVSITGTTGARSFLPEGLREGIRRLKRITDKPVCVGFGISTPSQVRQIAAVADGVIVGSALIKVIEKNIGRKAVIKRTISFLRRLTCML